MNPTSSVLAAVERTIQGYKICLTSRQTPEGDVYVDFDASAFPPREGLFLHWAVSSISAPSEWVLAPKQTRPEETVPFRDGIACRTRLDAHNKLTFHFPVDIIGKEQDQGERHEQDNVDPLMNFLAIMVQTVPSEDDKWLHADDGKSNLTVTLRPSPPVPAPAVAAAAIASRAAKHERGGETNLFRRYCLVREAIDSADKIDDIAGFCALYAWLRLSNIRLLPWHNGGNYQGKDMTHVQRELASSMAQLAAKGGEKGHICRLSLGMLPRGGGDGDAIRMGILQIMRENGIKEGHRPGIEDKFIEQWHQKLHSNTSKDDIAICEAYLHFLHGSGDWGDFWSFLYQHYHLTKEYLANIKAGWRSNGITGPGNHMPHLIPAFQHFLWILKVAHSGADMDTAAQMARGGLADDLQWDVDDLLRNRDQWWVPGKIVEIRKRLANVWRNPGHQDSGMLRNILLLDIALESFFRTRQEAMDLDTLSRDDHAVLMELALENGLVAVDNEALNKAFTYWKRVTQENTDLPKWSEQWAMIAAAALDNIALALSQFLDKICTCVASSAWIIGKANDVAESNLLNFGEEVARGHTLQVVSALMAKVQDEVRKITGQKLWRILSQASPNPSVVGHVFVQNLSNLQGENLEQTGLRRIVLSTELGGLEDISPDIAAVLTRSQVDLLSHIAIRARNTGTLLASCSDIETWESFTKKDGTLCRVSIMSRNGEVSLEEATPAEANTSMAANGTTAGNGCKVISMIKPDLTDKWLLQPGDFTVSLVGGKSMNLERLRSVSSRSGPSICVPPCFALPYGCFERAIRGNAEIHTKFLAQIAALKSGAKDIASIRLALKALRDTVMELDIPEGLSYASAKIPRDNDSYLSKVAPSLAKSDEDKNNSREWNAIKQVWASKWTERAFLSRRAYGMPEDDLYMAVLCMELIPADYAFVLHSKNPVAGAAEEVVGEVVIGLGETLVSNTQGRALSFSASGTDHSQITINAFPSKVDGCFCPVKGVMIARSDSNGEDLDGYAGAGLYDSIAAEPTVNRVVDYAREPLIWDSKFRESLILNLVNLAKNVETELGCPQDIEGCIANGNMYLLQARAQV